MNKTAEKTVYTKGQQVEIFEMWRTQERSEGVVTLVKFISKQDDYEYWTVKFSDGGKYDRFILAL